MSDSKPKTHERRFYRLGYPPIHRPKLNVGILSFEISELSEGGLVCLGTNQLTLGLNIEFTGTIVFSDGTSEKVQGKVIRKNGMQIVAELTQGISLKKMHEQHRLLGLPQAK